jgi:hypothetical protein
MNYEIEVFEVCMKMPSVSENKKNKQIAIDSRQFGPENPSLDPKANKPFWAGPVNISRDGVPPPFEIAQRLRIQ